MIRSMTLALATTVAAASNRCQQTGFAEVLQVLAKRPEPIGRLQGSYPGSFQNRQHGWTKDTVRYLLALLRAGKWSSINRVSDVIRTAGKKPPKR